MRIVFLSHTAMGGSFVVGSHQLAKVLALAGHSVFHISAPLSLLHLALAGRDPFVRLRLRRWFQGGKQISGVIDIVPFSILSWPVARYSGALMASYSRLVSVGPFRGLRALHLHDADCVIVDEPRLFGLALTFGKSKIVYRATDLYASLSADAQMEVAERRMCSIARALVATSEPVAQHLRDLSGRPVEVILNGVDFEHFAVAAAANGVVEDLPGTPDSRAIYVGSFDDRFGARAVERASKDLPGKHFILAGPGADAAARKLQRPNIHSLGPVSYSQLPALLQACSVGLLPLSPNPANRGRSPMKLYEYAAAGLCVAATATEELRGRQLENLFLADDDAEFSVAAASAFEAAKDPVLRSAGKERARQHEWKQKAATLIEVVAAAA